ncbi:YafY family transcriptional regulator [Rhodopseudomonas sp. P2A-2r]|uniref:helix-turn-helix transcriptional regulator n=1 Tax=Rhodopseudomonas sp. P2A-2r TaxID=2991972 RepID=UPI002234CFEB|nr:YafY family protein [Rhodopseudomonas sp. P2A-2r]UZE51390.1 YafY family transcriptional regulator [Rhodopseudomonas sp. P2A-2r]
MSRATRLLSLIQALRRRRRPVTAAVLAVELEVSERTIYRDIATLMAQGAPIEGAAGLGYVLHPGFVLPPLMFVEDEIDALVLGLRMVTQRGDRALRAAAADALAKISGVLPAELRARAEASALLAGPSATAPAVAVDVAALRQAIVRERRLAIDYVDASGARTARTVWPLALGFFDHAQVLVAWCERQNDFRHFRIDRLASVTPGERYGRRRRTLLAEWRARHAIPEQI